jgi:hypothetical protein
MHQQPRSMILWLRPLAGSPMKNQTSLPSGNAPPNCNKCFHGPRDLMSTKQADARKLDNL